MKERQSKRGEITEDDKSTCRVCRWVMRVKVSSSDDGCFGKREENKESGSEKNGKTRHFFEMIENC